MTIITDDYWIVWFTGNTPYSIFHITGLPLTIGESKEKQRERLYHENYPKTFQLTIQSLEEFEELEMRFRKNNFKIISNYRLETVKQVVKRVFIDPNKGIPFLGNFRCYILAVEVTYDDFYKFLDFLEELSFKYKYKTYYINVDTTDLNSNKIALVVK